MVRTILSALCLFVVVGFVAAEEKKADGKTTTGKFKSLKDGTLTISVGKKGEEAKDVTFKVGDLKNATVVVAKDDKKEQLVAEAFKDLKEGTPVIVKLEGEKVTGITIMVGKPK